jgi:hypothetical protein
MVIDSTINIEPLIFRAVMNFYNYKPANLNMWCFARLKRATPGQGKQIHVRTAPQAVAQGHPRSRHPPTIFCHSVARQLLRLPPCMQHFRRAPLQLQRLLLPLLQRQIPAPPASVQWQLCLQLQRHRVGLRPQLQQRMPHSPQPLSVHLLAVKMPPPLVVVLAALLLPGTETRHTHWRQLLQARMPAAGFWGSLRSSMEEQAFVSVSLSHLLRHFLQL